MRPGRRKCQPLQINYPKKDYISWKNWPYANLQLQIPFFWVYYKNGLKGLADPGVWRALESLLKFLLFSKGMFLEAEIGLLRLTILKWWRAQIGPSCRNLTRLSKWWIRSGWSSRPKLCNLTLWIIQGQLPARWGYGGVCGCRGWLPTVQRARSRLFHQYFKNILISKSRGPVKIWWWVGVNTLQQSQ